MAQYYLAYIIVHTNKGWVGRWVWGLAFNYWAIDDARAVGDDEDKTGNDEG